MKNISFIKLLGILTLFATLSCKENFLDVKPGDSVPFDSAIKNEAEMQGAVNGMYSALRSANLYGRTIPLLGDLMADNVYVSASNSNRYITHGNYTVNSLNGDVSGLWVNGYNAILRANQIINATISPETAASKQLKGEAYAIRGLMHFDLVRHFGQPFTVGPDAAGVPIITKFDPNLKPARNTVKEVYTQVIADLTQAATLMTVKKAPIFMSSAGAKAILARVYMYQGDWDKALASANDVITNGGYKLAASTAYVDYWKNPVTQSGSETIFEINADNVNNVGFDALAGIYDQTGYGDMLCDTSLFNLYRAADVRKGLLIVGKRGGADAIIVNKYPNNANANEKDELKVARLPEMHLIAAEAYYNKNDAVNALKSLNVVAQQREPGFAGYASTGAAIFADILTERRKELAFEGHRFWDLARLKLPVVRSAYYPAAARNIPATDNRRIQPIPQIELDANKAVTQNPGY
jgi:starch-binding outer membrane protein, SusD/RagB family